MIAICPDNTYGISRTPIATIIATMSVSAIEPMMPENCHELDDKAVELIEKSSSFAGMVNPDVALAVGDLVRSMNCYYSNFIEGHDTHPRDIARAMAEDFDSSEENRDLQLEAKAHIEVQSMIDSDGSPHNALSKDFALWTHKEFCERLPKSMLWVKNPDTGETIQIIPGRLRETFVKAGRHIPPSYEDLKKFMARFEEAYDPAQHSKVQRFMAASA